MMVRLEKKSNELNKSYKLTFGYDYFEITVGTNSDLYWIYYPSNITDSKEFIIKKDDEPIYEIFDKLYNNIKNNSIYDDLEPVTTYTKYSPYKDGKITWYSDDYKIEEASSLLIEKLDEDYKITFNKSKDRKYMYSSIYIRFRNSGSRYNPYNNIFTRMYNDMDKYIDKEKQLIKK